MNRDEAVEYVKELVCNNDTIQIYCEGIARVRSGCNGLSLIHI